MKKVNFNNGKSIEYNNGILSKLTDADGVVYLYETVTAARNGASEYLTKLKTVIDLSGVRYEINTTNGEITFTEEGSTYVYDSAGKLKKLINVEGEIEYAYDGQNNYIGSIFTLVDGTVRKYNESNNLLEKIETNGLTYEYYQSGPFFGKLEKETRLMAALYITTTKSRIAEG